MTKKQLLQAGVGIFLLAIMAECAWLYEITMRLEWRSLAWLHCNLYSPYFICLFAATAYLLPFLTKHRQISDKVILTWLSITLLNVTVFHFGDAVLKSLFSKNAALISIEQNFKIRLLGVFAVLIFAFGYHIITSELITQVKKQQAALFLMTIFLTFSFGYISVFFIRGFGKGDDLVDAVKMGYPQFWICILLGISGIITNMFLSDEEE